eukprot:g13739.t1
MRRFLVVEILHLLVVLFDERHLFVRAQLESHADDGWAVRTKEKKVQYSFGMNWDHFADWITVSTDEDSLDGVSLQHRLNPVIGQLQVDFDLSAFRGKTFLDLGCGSGILSTAARQLGAKHIVSVDVQPKSLSATHKLRNWAFFRDSHVEGEQSQLGVTTFEQAYFYGHEQPDYNATAATAKSEERSFPYTQLYDDEGRSWTIVRGSILDPALGDFLRSVLGLTEANQLHLQATHSFSMEAGKVVRGGTAAEESGEEEDASAGQQSNLASARPVASSFDLVYSYGVLHHTGNLAEALRRAIPLTKINGGRCFVALYNRRMWPHERDKEWIDLKEEYLGSRPWRKQLMELSYLLADVFRDLRNEVDRFDAVSEKLAIAMAVHPDRVKEWGDRDLLEVLAGKYVQPAEVFLGEEKDVRRDDGEQEALAAGEEHEASCPAVDLPGQEGDALLQSCGDPGKEKSAGGAVAAVGKNKLPKPSLKFDELPDRQRQQFMRNFLYQKFNSNSLGRGMSYLIETRDNLGGYPVEYSQAGWMTTLLQELCPTCKVTKIDEVATTGYLMSLTAMDIGEESAGTDENLANEVSVLVSPEAFGGNDQEEGFQERYMVAPRSHSTIFTGCYDSPNEKNAALQKAFSKLVSTAQCTVRRETATPSSAATAADDNEKRIVDHAHSISRSCYGVWRRQRAIRFPPKALLPLELFLESQSEALIGARAFLKVAQESVGRHLGSYALDSLLKGPHADGHAGRGGAATAGAGDGRFEALLPESAGFLNTQRFVRQFAQLAGMVPAEQAALPEETIPYSPAQFDLVFLSKAVSMYYAQSVELGFKESVRRAIGENSLKLYKRRLYGMNPFYEGRAYLPAAERVIQHLGRVYRERSKAGVDEETYERPGKEELSGYLEHSGLLREDRSEKNSDPPSAPRNPAYRCFVAPLRWLFESSVGAFQASTRTYRSTDAGRRKETNTTAPPSAEDAPDATVSSATSRTAATTTTAKENRNNEEPASVPASKNEERRALELKAKEFFDLNYENPDLDAGIKFPHSMKLLKNGHFLGFSPNDKTEIAIFVDDEGEFQMALDGVSDFVNMVGPDGKLLKW